MPFQQTGDIRYYTFNLLKENGLFHAALTRNGGFSPDPWRSLNLGGTVGDEPARVRANKERVFTTLGCSIQDIYDVWQVHSAEVVCVDEPRPFYDPHKKADAILTNKPGVILFMRFADCVPIVLYDPTQRVVGIVHAGWLGTVKQVAKAAINRMDEVYGCKPENILAGIGPSIAAHHYPVGEDVAAHIRSSFGEDAASFLSGEDGRITFDLWEANRMLLQDAGVKQIEVSGICTACHLEDWYSHRGEFGRTGRFGVIASIT